MKIKSKLVALILPAIMLANTAFATKDFSAIDRYVNAAKKEIGLPSGTAIAIVKDGNIIYEGYFGYADIKAKKKVTDKTAFYIASITKPMFALSTLLMEHKGDIRDNTSMVEMFPKQDFPNIDAEKIQLKHLMSCTSGIDNDELLNTLAYTGNHNLKQRHTLMSASAKNKKSPLGQFEYTNLGFNIASVWVDNYYQQDWQKTLSEAIYQPLEMNHTSSYMSDAVKKGIEVARPYGLMGKDPKEILSFEKSDSTMHAGGGTIATATDLSRFLIAQLNEGKVDGKQIFPAKVIKKSQQQLTTHNEKFFDFKRTGYAWGWHIGPYKGENMYHHFGGVAGTHTHSSFIVKKNIGLVVLNNENYISQDFTNAIADIAYSIMLNQGDANKKADAHIIAMKDIWAELKPKFKVMDERDANRSASRVMEISLEKLRYEGIYHNELLGDLSVELVKSGKFKFSLGEVNAMATAFWKPDTMRVEFKVMNEGGKVATYDITEGEIQGLNLMGKYFKKH
jgi:CubicO group peptidase (beta-lactamase class C family)